MTLQNYIDNVMLGLNFEFAALDLDEGTVGMFVNQARKQVFTATNEQYPALYTLYKDGSASTLAFATADNFVRETAVVIRPGGATFVPARRVSVKEWNSVLLNSFNPPTTSSPIYKVVNKTVTLLPTAQNIRVYFVQGPTDLPSLSSAETLLPDDTQELVIRRAQAYCYEKLSMTDARDAIQMEYESQLKQLMDDWQDAESNIRVALSSKTAMQNG